MGVRMTSPLRVRESLDREFQGADFRATECVINLLRAGNLVEQRLTRRFREYGLSPATFNVLMILEGDPKPLCPYQIGERLLVTRGTVTGLLDSLEKRGLVLRAPHPDDRRMLLIRITEAGRRLLVDLLPEHFRGEAEMLGPLTPREKETLVRLLGKVQAVLEEPAGRQAAATA